MNTCPNFRLQNDIEWKFVCDPYQRLSELINDRHERVAVITVRYMVVDDKLSTAS